MNGIISYGLWSMSVTEAMRLSSEGVSLPCDGDAMVFSVEGDSHDNSSS